MTEADIPFLAVSMYFAGFGVAGLMSRLGPPPVPVILLSALVSAGLYLAAWLS